jgi:hypothetical protein
MNIQTEISLHIERIERETYRPCFHPLIIKFQALKFAIKDVFKNERHAYEQLMLAEIALGEVEPSPQSATALDHIANAKGLLACLALTILCLGAMYDDDEYTRARGRARRQREEQVA